MITNLAPNPSLKTSAAGWYGTDGWARADGLGTGMLRRYVFRGDVTTDVAMPRISVVPGRWYRAAVQVKVYGAATIGTALHWYTSGGAYMDPASVGADYVKTGPDTFVATIAAKQAPAGAAQTLLNLTGVPKAQLTAYIVREFLSEAEASAADMTFFDGDSDGGDWVSGTDGPSTMETSGTAAFAISLPEPTVKITAAQRDTTLALALALPAPTVGFGLITEVSYDDARGRVRIDASGFPDEVIRVVVSRRVLGTYRWAEVRGGRVSVVNNALARTVDDYEFATGETMEYRVQALSTSEGVPDVLVFSRTLTILAEPEAVWVKFIPRPSMNLKVRMSLWDPIEYQDRNQVYLVDGEEDPVVISSSHSSATTTVRFFTETLAERDRLVTNLRQGYPIFLHTPPDLAFPSMYASVGRVRTELRGNVFKHKHVVTVPLTEVAPPPLSIVPAGVTWQEVVDTYGSWDDVLLATTTWAELIDG